jgi:hypothetical protein
MNMIELMRLANELEDDFKDSNLCGLAASIILNGEFSTSPLASPFTRIEGSIVTFEVLSYDPEGENKVVLGTTSRDMLNIRLTTGRHGEDVTIRNIPFQCLRREIIVALLKRTKVELFTYQPLKFRSANRNEDRRDEIVGIIKSTISDEVFIAFIQSTFDFPTKSSAQP